jgi:hypothetical protein
MRASLRVGVTGLVLAVAATLLPMGTAMADEGAVLPVTETETFVVPSGLAGGCVSPETWCLVDNGSIGSDCNEVELTPMVSTAPIGVNLGEGLDGFLCQAFISATLTVSGCSVSGSGQLTFQEDNPVEGAAGGAFDFNVSGTIDRAVMAGTNAGPGGGQDVTAGTMSLGSNCAVSGTALYSATATFEFP